jgi:apolipoprotein N-acyltransferase
LVYTLEVMNYKKIYKLHTQISPKISMVLLFLLSVVGLSLPFVWYQAGWLSIFSFVPFIFFLKLISQKKLSVVRQLGLIWATGIAIFMIILSWALQTDPEKWAYINGWQAVFGMWAVYVAFAIALSIQYLVFGGLFLAIKPKFNNKSIFLLLPAMWCVAEATRSIMFSIFFMGPGGSIGTYWNFGVLGVAGAVTPLGYLARVVGMFGLSFIIVVVNICIFWLIQKRWKLPLSILIGIFALGLICYFVWKPPANSRKIVTGYLQQSLVYQTFQGDMTYYELVGKLAAELKEKTDILVLPEYSQFFIDTEQTNTEQYKLAQTTAQEISNANGSIITSTENTSTGKKTNRVVLYSVTGVLKAFNDKTFLIPLGEYMPYVFIGIFKLMSQEQLLYTHQQMRQIAQGQSSGAVFSGENNIKLGSLACSGAIAPELYRSLARNGAEVLTNSANLGIFTNAPFYHQQSQQFARFIALSNARPYVQSAAGAYSYSVSGDGEFVSKTDDLGFKLQTTQASLGQPRTIYTIIGEWVVWLSALILIAVVFIKSFGVKKKK